MAISCETTNSDSPILQILLIGFHHQKGSIVEYCFPDDSLPQQWRQLPHIALPDGCHNYQEGHVMFSLPSIVSPDDDVVFGVSCYRQIDSNELDPLLSSANEITRSTVQKSITVISRWPVFGFLRTKLELTTCAFFSSKVFTDRDLLIQTYDNLNATLNKDLALRICCHSNQLTHQVDNYQYILLQIFKAILLEKRVLVYGPNPTDVSSFITSLLSLLPLYYQHLIDRSTTCSQGLPLSHFCQQSNVQPYLPLQDMRKLTQEKEGGLLVGVANPIFYKRASELCDVCLVMESKLMEMYDSNLTNKLSLSTADLRFCRLLKESLTSSRDGVESGNVAVGNWSGSTEWIQAQFKEYLISLLSACHHGDLPTNDDFNSDFMEEFTNTTCYRTWLKSAPLVEVPPDHVCKGDLTLSDLKNHLLVEVNELVGSEQVDKLVRKTGKNKCLL